MTQGRPNTSRIASALLVPALEAWRGVPVYQVLPGQEIPDTGQQALFLRPKPHRDRWRREDKGMHGEVRLGVSAMPWDWPNATAFRNASGFVDPESDEVRRIYLEHAPDVRLKVLLCLFKRVSRDLAVARLKVSLQLTEIERKAA